MKKIILLVFTVLCLAGCGTAAERAEFWKHDTMYQNWDHFMFSAERYKNPTLEDVKKTNEQGWWGTPVQVK